MDGYRLFVENEEKEGTTYHTHLKGNSDPPPRIVNGETNGDYLPSTITDMGIVEHAIPWTDDTTTTWPNVFVARGADSSLPEQRASGMIRESFARAKSDNKPGSRIIEIYHTGHGQKITGNWCFSNEGRISLQDIMDIARKYRAHFDCLNLLSDCCHSGNWCEKLKDWEGKVVDFNINIYASSWPRRLSWGDRDGSDWTIFMYNPNGITNPEGESQEIRWSRASLTKDGVYKMTHMIATTDVEDQVETISGKVKKLKEIVEQLDSIGLSEQWTNWSHISGVYYFQHFDSNFEHTYAQFIELKKEIDEIQGPEYLKAIKLSTTTIMSTSSYSFMVECGLKWVEDEQKIERFKKKSMKSEGHVQTEVQTVAEKMENLEIVVKQINSCNEIIDRLFEKEHWDDSNRQQFDSTKRDKIRRCVDFHSLKKEIISTNGANYLQESACMGQVGKLEFSVRGRLLTAENTDTRRLKDLESTANEVEIHWKERRQLYSEDKEKYDNSRESSDEILKPLFRHLLFLKGKFDESHGEAYLEGMRIKALSGSRSVKFYMEQAILHSNRMDEKRRQHYIDNPAACVIL